MSEMRQVLAAPIVGACTLTSYGLGLVAGSAFVASEALAALAAKTAGDVGAGEKVQDAFTRGEADTLSAAHKAVDALDGIAARMRGNG